MCKYKWCWTCGFSNNSNFHRITGNGIPCKLMNAFTFGFECKFCHWSIRCFVSILVIAALPALLYLLSIFLCTWFIYYNMCEGCKVMFFCFRRDSNNGKGSCLLVMLLTLIEFCFIFALATVVGSIIYALLIVPIILYLLFFFVRVLY